ncbi:bacteriocin immunity protein, partial [Streptococcus pyogenes]
NDISWYLVLNKYEAPQPVIDFAQQIAKEPHKEKGKLAFLQSLALSLIH